MSMYICLYIFLCIHYTHMYTYTYIFVYICCLYKQTPKEHNANLKDTLSKEKKSLCILCTKIICIKITNEPHS